MINLERPLNICRASAGTGKTYTLAAYYIGLLLSGEDYRSILAITFTNKATAEVSERILGYLHAIAEGTEKGLDFLKDARKFMIARQTDSNQQLQECAEQCFRQMLLDYDNVQILTIDAFLQTLYSGLASVLHMSAGQQTELDVKHVIAQAVDQLLTTDLTPEARAILEELMQVKLEQAQSWDVRGSIKEMANKLYDETAQALDAENRILFNAAEIAQRRQEMEQAWQTNEDRKTLGQLLAQCDSSSIAGLDLKAYERLRKSLDDPQKVKYSDRFRGRPESKNPLIAQASEIGERLKKTYNTLTLPLSMSREMQLMASLKALIDRNLADSNRALLAETSTKLAKALKSGDADFILEKAGVRYKHILMDEFQDTSHQQWHVIEQLVRDMLAGEGHTLLVVGDIKQSIYRWRNGDWHIMASMGSDEQHLSAFNNTDFQPLIRNYRSKEQVVQFNLSLFRDILDHYPYQEEKALIENIYDEGFRQTNIEDYYKSPGNRGGFVRFRAYPYHGKANAKEVVGQMIDDMFDTMEDLLQKGADASDFMVLVRYNSEARNIVDCHAHLDAERYPLLSQARFVSADSFVLESSQAVRTLIDALRVIANKDEVAAQYVASTTQKPELIDQIRQMEPKMPLYEAVSELIKLLFTNEEGRYEGTETAYLNSLLDKTRHYVTAYGSSIADFIEYWDDTLHDKSIPASAGKAIRIMTIHTSKGLEAQTLFVPLCHWVKEGSDFTNIKNTVWCEIKGVETSNEPDMVPLEDGESLLESLYEKDYLREHLNMRIDNLNMLYVALTRAKDNLFISSDFSITKDGLSCKHVGEYILDFTGLKQSLLEASDFVEVSCGQPVIAPTSDESVEAVYVDLWANSDQVKFVQSQEGALYTVYGDEAYRRVARMDTGNLCHEIFAHIRKADQLDHVLDEFENKGDIRSAEQKQEIRTLIASAWQGSPEMRDWFTAPWQLKLEEPIYLNSRELRPDRVMINPETNEAIVLDYKFGEWNEKYLQQVRDYMAALRNMGHQPVRGYLWFARKNKLVEVHE